MTLDIRGGLKNTTISSNKYVVFEELLTNSIDSYLIRKNEAGVNGSLDIAFDIEFFPTGLLGEVDVRVTCTDNGAGFGDEQIKAFVTKDTTYKDYLKIPGVGRCKGAGRIQFFHYFKEFSISSVSCFNQEFKKVKLDVGEFNRDISEDDFKVVDDIDLNVKTTVALEGLKENVFDKIFSENELQEVYSAKLVKNHILVSSLQRLIYFVEKVGDFKITIRERRGDETKIEELVSSDLPTPSSTTSIEITCQHSEDSKPKNQHMQVIRYSLPAIDYSELQHEVALCANSASVISIIHRFLRTKSERNKPINNSYELILVESEVFENSVNEQRDGFNIPQVCSVNEELDNSTSLQDILDSLEDYVYTILTPSDFDREELIKSTESMFGISNAMLNDTKVKVRYTDTESNIATRVLKKYQEEIVKETTEIFNMKQELLGLDPRSDIFREQISELSWKFTGTMKSIDMANLSQLVVRRSAMLEVLQKAVDSLLDCQVNSGRAKQNEKIIHNIFFPMGKDTNDTLNHDIWILNEEYHYFSHIASDKALSSIPWDDNSKLFSKDIDESLEALFAKNNVEHSRKRPDIAIFNEEGSAIIIELKAPGVELQDHINDLIQYARLLCAKSNGRIKKIYGYLIGNCLDESRMPPEFERFPSERGYFNTAPIRDPRTGMPYGELYSEVLFYDHFTERARNRLKIYKEKLKLGF